MDPREKREDETWAEYGARMAGMGIAPVDNMLAGGFPNIPAFPSWGDFAPDVKDYAKDKGWVTPGGFGSYFLDPTKDLNLLPDVPPGGQYHSAVEEGMGTTPDLAMTRFERSKLQLPIGPLNPLPDLKVPAFTPLGPTRQVPARITPTFGPANDPVYDLSATDSVFTGEEIPVAAGPGWGLNISPTDQSIGVTWGTPPDEQVPSDLTGGITDPVRPTIDYTLPPELPTVVTPNWGPVKVAIFFLVLLIRNTM